MRVFGQKCTPTFCQRTPALVLGACALARPVISNLAPVPRGSAAIRSRASLRLSRSHLSSARALGPLTRIRRCVRGSRLVAKLCSRALGPPSTQTGSTGDSVVSHDRGVYSRHVGRARPLLRGPSRRPSVDFGRLLLRSICVCARHFTLYPRPPLVRLRRARSPTSGAFGTGHVTFVADRGRSVFQVPRG